MLWLSNILAPKSDPAPGSERSPRAVKSICQSFVNDGTAVASRSKFCDHCKLLRNDENHRFVPPSSISSIPTVSTRFGQCVPFVKHNTSSPGWASESSIWKIHCSSEQCSGDMVATTCFYSSIGITLTWERICALWLAHKA